MRLRINGIFDKYNNEVDFDRKCTIFIGENGVGKSTTMKIINAFLSGNFVELLKYYFRSIEVFNDNKLVLEVKYEYLFPKVEDILKMTREYDNNEDFFNDYNSLQLNVNIIFKHYDKLVKFIKKDTYIYNNLIRTILNEGLEFSLDGFKSQYNIEDGDLFNSSLVLLTFYKRVVTIGDFKNIKYIENTVFSNREYFKVISELLNNYKNVFLISTVKELNITNDIYRLVPAYYSISDEFKRYNQTVDSEDYSDSSNIYLEIDKKERFLRKYFGEVDLDTIINSVSIENIYKDYSIYDDLNGKYNDDSKSCINIKKLLFKNYYTEDVINKFNRDYYTMLKKMIYREYLEDELNDDLFIDNKDLNNKFNLFIVPLIPRGSFYRNFMNNTNVTKFSYEAKVFNKFVLDNIDFYSNYESDSIRKLNELFSEYFKSKKIYCSPNGLVISLEKDFFNRFNINYLSEGERRIILLLLLTVLNDNNVLLLDEIETSLSVVWQQRLVNDILNYGVVDHLIVSTQSPFIVGDDNLMDYVTCLPYDVRGDSYEN